MIDLEALDTEIRQRIRAQVSEFAFDDTSDNLDEEVLRTCSAPAVFTMIIEPSAAELVPGSKGQKIALEVFVGIVTQSVASRSGANKGAKGSLALKQKTKKAIHFWKPALTLEKLKFRGEEQPIRQAGRLLRQLRFTASLNETYS